MVVVILSANYELAKVSQMLVWERQQNEMLVQGKIRYRICPALVLAQDGANYQTGNYCSGGLTLALQQQGP